LGETKAQERQIKEAATVGGLGSQFVEIDAAKSPPPNCKKCEMTRQREPATMSYACGIDIAPNPVTGDFTAQFSDKRRRDGVFQARRRVVST
jgi:hypothetical protein